MSPVRPTLPRRPRLLSALGAILVSAISLCAAEPEALRRQVAPGEAGFYEIRDSVLRLEAGASAGRNLRAQIARGASAVPDRATVQNPVKAGDTFTFDTFVGYLSAGDSVAVTAAPSDGQPAAEIEKFEFNLVRVPSIAVSRFSEDAMNGRSGWSLSHIADPASPAARRLARGLSSGARPAGFDFGNAAPRLQRGEATEGASVASFRVPHSGFYALQEVQAALKGRPADAVLLRVFVGDATAPLFERTIGAADPRPALDGEIGYVAKGEAIHLAFSAAATGSPVDLEFDATISEWAPRRAPLRAARGADGLLDVYEPEDQRRAVDIPADRWIRVPAADGDRTDAIREAIARARELAEETPDGYVGVRLDAGAKYLIASTQTGGRTFELTGARRVVFDGNGATLFVASPDLQRKGVTVFTTRDSHRIVFADLIVDSGPPPFATGEIVSAVEAQGGGHVVTFRLDPGSPDPVADIGRATSPPAYVYDLLHPGRMAEGVWSHYPGGAPIESAGSPNLFKHTVRRTAGLPENGKWVVKNKGGGVIYLTTYGGSEDITLSGVQCRAPGGGLLRFWSANAVNLLNCRVEPRDGEWISSTADGVHGRGREGVWIEDTLLRGVCEDVMNTYAQSMVALEDPEGTEENVVTLRIFSPGRRNAEGEFLPLNLDAASVLPGDPLAFFDPKTGRELGRVTVLSVDRDGRCALSGPVPAGMLRWKKGGDRKTTMVYSLRQTTRFFVRDSRFMDGMRFGIFIKAEGGVVFNSHFEGLAATPILATNEPEWPEGPVPSNLWIQGSTFSQNNNSYISLHRDFLTVDPASINVYARRMTDPEAPDDFRAHLVRDHYIASHMKIVGNVFHDWAGMGVAIRNSRNVEVRNNLFLPPVETPLLRKTLSQDPLLANPDRADTGIYTGVFLETVGGARVGGNRFSGLPKGDRQLVLGEDVSDIQTLPDDAVDRTLPAPRASLDFSEWFGDTSADASGKRRLRLDRVAHVNGRFGAGLRFDGAKSLATLPALAGAFRERSSGWTISLWIQPAATPSPASVQVIYAQGDTRNGVIVALRGTRLVGGAWREGRGVWLDLGEAPTNTWTHLALTCDGATGTLTGYVDGIALASDREDSLNGAAPSPESLASVFGNTSGKLYIAAGVPVASRSAPYRGDLDEFFRFSAALTPADLALLALRHP